MKDHFDLIAMPKGQMPGGPIQASDGAWYIVLPVTVDAKQAWQMYCSMRAGRPVTDAEIAELRNSLNQSAANFQPLRPSDFDAMVDGK